MNSVDPRGRWLIFRHGCKLATNISPPFQTIMAVSISNIDSGAAIEIAVSDKLHKEDFAAFVPVIEKAVEEHGKVRVLFDMDDFRGWETSALWEELKFDAKHFHHFERIAMIGDKKWEKAMALFCKPFTTAKLRYFDRAEKEEAKRWLLADS